MNVFNFNILKARENFQGQIEKGHIQTFLNKQNRDCSNILAMAQVFLYNYVVFTTSHKNFVLNYTVSISIWMSLLFRECYLLFHFFKKELCLGGMHCHLLFCESNGGRDRAAERE